MDVVPKRPWIVLALVAIACVSLIMMFSGSLDGAAAWANIIALPVAIAGVYLTLRGSVPAAGSQGQESDGGGVASNSAASVVNQHGYTSSGDVIQVARDYVVRDWRDSGGR
jgi:hypothetical protein